MNIARHLIPGPVKQRYLDIKKRLDRLELTVRGLETALDAMLVNPKYVPGDDIGFNGQRHRKKIFGDIIANLPVEAIVETGTWIGNTTAYMAQTSEKPVCSCELNARFHAIAKLRLAGIERVQLELNDSRSFLQKLTTGGLVEKCVFFYLDAHWYDDLPLAKEVDLIAAHWKRFIVMIDDFKVSDDPGYEFDDYGNGKTLALPLINEAIAAHQLAAFFPAAAARDETGARRGCVVLASRGELAGKLSQLTSLRPAK
ncbi:MAG: hypothetical protein EXS33_01755 [Pedosphaera sp.]|nr:hypothetical protein [Pedosphaera sp.]